ncbi:fibronectin type III domain protein [Nocardioides sp. J9]|uniref:fibronectin type III domain-containing protein n=1 Tax=Nocardioides sp. J9 TaxID=935844 RepID=UPI0011A958CD|nr:fibronectin type III domain-containing protein [Nocardioides sp. J9]TWH03151.1 fibronectin type III domain protein [Nocardioides sp. J9]
MLRSTVLGTTLLALALTGATVPAAATEEPGHPDGVELGVEHGVDHGVVTAADGSTYAVDEWGPPPAEPPAEDRVEAALASTLTASATTDVFRLHSKPGSNRTIYLDFKGGLLLAGNSWLLQGLTTLLYPGWSLDSSPAFSDAERAVILEVWARMAEDFAPFDIDVTTEEPPLGALWRATSSDQTYGTRVAFSSGTAIQDALCRARCGGVAWIGTFDSILTKGETRSPAWVFPSSLGNRAKSMAEAGSHEAGHTLGLAHDGTATSGYYAGTTLWGPLMGSPYSSSVTQWSKGDYPGANNREDDIQVAISNGAPLRADEAGSTVATAVPLSSLPGGRGIIGTRTDEDWLQVTDCSGAVTVHAEPAAVGANLDIGLELRDAAGALVASAATATSRTSAGLEGMDARLSRTVSGGTFHVVVKGIGSGLNSPASWPVNGYDDFGSLGAYTVSVTGCSVGEPGTGTPDTGTPGGEPVTEEPVVSPPPVTATPKKTRPGAPKRPGAVPGARGGRRTVTASWARPATGGAPITRYQVRAFRLATTGRVVARTAPRAVSSTVRKASLRLPKGRWVVRVRARNAVGWGPWSVASARVTPR